MSGTPLHFTRDIAADHPAFAGHFPGRPLLPGVLLLAEVLEAVRGCNTLQAVLGHRPGIASAKFLAPVAPGSRLSITLTPLGDGAEFVVDVASVRAASGRLIAAQDSIPETARGAGAAP
jgi:3-hydroxymyristoyl/3-hydroxydecanoyl-(acyl carrier protein) dehydratase